MSGALCYFFPAQGQRAAALGATTLCASGHTGMSCAGEPRTTDRTAPRPCTRRQVQGCAADGKDWGQLGANPQEAPKKNTAIN